MMLSTNIGFSELKMLLNDVKDNKLFEVMHLPLVVSTGGAWEISNKQNDHKLEFIRPLAHACCTLHNIYKTFGTAFNQHRLF